MNQRPDVVLRRMSSYCETIQEKLKHATREEKQEMEDDLHLLDTILEDMAQYTKAVFSDEDNKMHMGFIKEKTNSVQEFQDYMKDSDEKRKSCHDRLISHVALADRIAKFYGVEPLYGEFGEYEQDISPILDVRNYDKGNVLQTRKQLAKWATELTLSCTVCMELGIEVDEIMQSSDFNVFASISEELKHLNSVKMMRNTIIHDDDLSK